MTTRSKIAAGLGLFTATAAVLYWASVFAGLFPVAEVVPGYRTWFMSFPLADAWIAVSGIWLFFALRGRWLSASAAAASLGSSLIFLGLYALSYGVNTGLIYVLTPDEIIEIAIKAYCVSVGIFLVWFATRGSQITHEPKETDAVDTTRDHDRTSAASRPFGAA